MKFTQIILGSLMTIMLISCGGSSNNPDITDENTGPIPTATPLPTPASTVEMDVIGGQSGTAFSSRLCENGLVPLLRISSGYYIDALQLSCKEPGSALESFAPTIGTIASALKLFQAKDGETYVGFKAQVCISTSVNPKPIICGLQLLSRENTKLNDAAYKTSGTILGIANNIAKYQASEPALSICDAGSILIGLKGTTDIFSIPSGDKPIINSLQAICSN